VESTSAGLEPGLEAPGDRHGAADGAGRLLLGSERHGGEQEKRYESHRDSGKRKRGA
jgi:hypothetical protein